MPQGRGEYLTQISTGSMFHKPSDLREEGYIPRAGLLELFRKRTGGKLGWAALSRPVGKMVEQLLANSFIPATTPLRAEEDPETRCTTLNPETVTALIRNHIQPVVRALALRENPETPKKIDLQEAQLFIPAPAADFSEVDLLPEPTRELLDRFGSTAAVEALLRDYASAMQSSSTLDFAAVQRGFRWIEGQTEMIPSMYQGSLYSTVHPRTAITTTLDFLSNSKKVFETL